MNPAFLAGISGLSKWIPAVLFVVVICFVLGIIIRIAKPSESQTFTKQKEELNRGGKTR
jgi:uncharacterized protein YpmS